MAKKLFELLVVEPQLKAQSQATRAELRGTFQNKRHLFEKKLVTFQPNIDGAPAVVEQQLDIQNTIPKELEWIAGIITKAIDTSYAVADGNTRARADVVLDNGQVLLTNVPATALLELEKRAGEFQDLLASVPTLDPAKGFIPAPEEGDHVFRAREDVKIRTQKIEEYVVIVPPTEHHPANVQKISKDIEKGTLRTQEWSALITPARKSVLLSRCEELRRAVKAALHRANALELPNELPTCGRQIFEFLLRD